MKNISRSVLALLLALSLLLTAGLSALAADAAFLADAEFTVLTGSDFQDLGTAAYDRFGRVLTQMKNDGMPTPDSMLVGGDYTKLLFDDAVPGVSQIRHQLVSVYPDADPEAVVCIQGNHDNMSPAFAKTGFSDMGAYNLYVINEDDFPWKQSLRPGIEAHIKEVSADIESHMNELIAAGDFRPVIVMTHLPLHHTTRSSYGENKYASYIFNALNKAGRTLDVIFLFGHQHSGDYDDYIGGSVNFLQAGDTIRVPKPDQQGENAYTNETLSFTYLNCGYIGYSKNTVSETSTNILTLGAIQFTADGVRFVKYGEDGVYKTWDVARKNAAEKKERTGYPALVNGDLWTFMHDLFMKFFTIYLRFIAIFAAA